MKNVRNQISKFNASQKDYYLKLWESGEKARIYVKFSGLDWGYINLNHSESDSHREISYKLKRGNHESFTFIIDSLLEEIEEAPKVEKSEPKARRAGVDYPCPKCGTYCFGDCSL